MLKDFSDFSKAQRQPGKLKSVVDFFFFNLRSRSRVKPLRC